MYTIAGLVPIADPNPVIIRPISNSAIVDAFAMRAHPITHGIAANLIVYKRPSHSIKIAAIRHPTGTESTITEAIHDVCSLLRCKSLSSLSTCGTKMAENANEMPITIWNEAAVAAAIIWIRIKLKKKTQFQEAIKRISSTLVVSFIEITWGIAVLRLFVSYVLSDRQLVITSRNASSAFCSSVSSYLYVSIGEKSINQININDEQMNEYLSNML